jgi:hypothetical protein
MGLPTDGRTLYVRLWALVNNIWRLYPHCQTPSSGTVAITNPVNGSMLTSGTVTFQWTAGTATQYG